MKQADAIDQLERDIGQLKIEFARYFAGDLDLPPDPQRQEVQNSIRQLRGTLMTSPVDRFRLSTLTARFNTLNELFNRRLREVDHGRRRRAIGPATRRLFDPGQGIRLGDRADADAVRSLYDALYKGQDEPQGGYSRFRDYLVRQVDTIRSNTGCAEVSFRVTRDGDKTSLKAKPIKVQED